MRRTIRKTHTVFDINYSNSNYSSLGATDISLDCRESEVQLTIDMTCNFRVRNKSAHWYEDARELTRDHKKLESIQIDEKQVISSMVTAYEKNPNAKWVLTLVVENEKFNYPVKPRSTNGITLLEVQHIS